MRSPVMAGGRTLLSISGSGRLAHLWTVRSGHRLHGQRSLLFRWVSSSRALLCQSPGLWFLMARSCLFVILSKSTPPTNWGRALRNTVMSSPRSSWLGSGLFPPPPRSLSRMCGATLPPRATLKTVGNTGRWQGGKVARAYSEPLPFIPERRSIRTNTPPIISRCS